MVSEEQIQKWADETDVGNDVEELKRRGRGRPGRGAEPMQVVAVRLTAEELDALDAAAAKSDMSRSEAIRAALDLLGDQMQSSLADRGLTVTQGALLWHLDAMGPVIQRALSDHLGVAARTVTGLVDDLVSSGWVERKPSTLDRRAWLVCLTPAGRREVRRMRAEREVFAASLCGALSDRQVETGSGVLQQISSQLTVLLSRGAGR